MCVLPDRGSAGRGLARRRARGRADRRGRREHRVRRPGGRRGPVVLVTARRIRRVDAEATIPVVEIGVLRRLPIFAPLPAASLETLAREAGYVSFPPGEVIIVEGEEGDSYYVITHGTVLVTKDDREIRRLTVGAGFGEIALLHPARRTATCRRSRDHRPQRRAARPSHGPAARPTDQPLQRGDGDRRRPLRATRAEAARARRDTSTARPLGGVEDKGGSKCPSSPI